MKTVATPLTLIATIILTACGGKATSTTAPTPQVTTYPFVVPTVNAVRTYSETIIDNASNTINLSYTDTVTSTNTNGTYVVLQQDPTNNSVTMNGTTYAIATESITVNNSDQPLSATNTTTQVICTVAPFGAGPTFPLTIGQTWTHNYTVTCGSGAAVAYTQSGSVIDLESVTVPAGTYPALKLQTTLSHTDANGTIHNQIIATWRDAATGIKVKQQVFNTYAGTTPTSGYPVADTIVLQSGTP